MVHITLRTDDEFIKTIDAMAETTGKSRNDLINRAIKLYIEAGGPEAEFEISLRKANKAIYGFQDRHELNEIMKEIIRDQTPHIVKEIYSDVNTLLDMAIKERLDTTRPQIPQKEKAQAEDAPAQALAYQGPRVIANDEDIPKLALIEIINRIEEGEQPSIKDIARKFNYDSGKLGSELAELGVFNKRTTIKGERNRYYMEECLDDAKKALEIMGHETT